jgi:hypothetical protein
MKKKSLLAQLDANLMVVLIALTGMALAWNSLSRTFGPFPDPVRYQWDSGKHCAVVYPKGSEVPCANFTKEELNKFRLEYTNPHRTKS